MKNEFVGNKLIKIYFRYLSDFGPKILCLRKIYTSENVKISTTYVEKPQIWMQFGITRNCFID